MRNGPILVGVDGSEPSESALRWACQEATRRDTGLVLLHAAPRPLVDLPVDARKPAEWGQAQELLERAERTARELAPGVDVRSELATEEGPAVALVQRAGDASLVVVGNRGHGGFVGLLVGSVALQVAGHAPSPVALVKAGLLGRKGGPVVTGVGSGRGEAQLEVAFQEATLRGGWLQVLSACWLPAMFRTENVLPQVSDLGQLPAAWEERVTGEVAPWREKCPGVLVEIAVVRDRARHALVDASAEADLLVVGRHNEGGRHALALGSVASAVAHHARCPVLIAGSD